MRISDWSSDVCSSDLLADRERAIDRVLAREPLRHERVVLLDEDGGALLERRTVSLGPPVPQRPVAVDPADRKSVVSGKSVSVRVDLGGRRLITKKHDKNHNGNTTLQ